MGEKLKIGKIFKGIREASGLSMEDVSRGLLSAKELSRFENDESYPGSYMLQILFERLGKSLKHFTIMMSKPEYEYLLWRRDIVAKIVRGQEVKQVVYPGSFGKYMDTPDINEKILLYKKAIELKRRNFKIEGLDRLLEGLLAEYQKINQQPPENFAFMLSTLSDIKSEYKIEKDTFWQIKPTYEVYLLNEVLQKYRSEKQKKVKDIAGNCCSEKTYRALENGMRDAKKGTLDLLCQELEIPYGVYNADIITDNYREIELVDKINMVSKRATKGDEIQLLHQLKQMLGNKYEYAQNRQFIDGKTDIALFFDKEITAEQYVERLKKLISMTIEEGHLSSEQHFFSKMEMILVYYNAVWCRRMGKPEEGLQIVNTLWQQIIQSTVILEDRKQEVLLLMILRKNLLTDIFNYEEALEIAVTGIKYSFSSGDASKLYDFVFEIGWIYDELAKEKNKFMKGQYRKYFEYALCISEMFYIERNARVIKRYLKQN